MLGRVMAVVVAVVMPRGTTLSLLLLKSFKP